MFGYDWPRLHAALNDLPAALLLAAVLFDLLGAATRRAGFRQVGFWILIAGAIGAGAGLARFLFRFGVRLARFLSRLGIGLARFLPGFGGVPFSVLFNSARSVLTGGEKRC